MIIDVFMDFFMMEDVFTEKQFLLFSPGVSNVLLSAKPMLWFNLIGSNGTCWQSYGPVVYYNGFEAVGVLIARMSAR